MVAEPLDPMAVTRSVGKQRSKTMRLAGAVLAVTSVLVILGYGGYLFFVDHETPLALKVAIPVGAVGLLVLLASVVGDRLKARGQEGLDEVEP